MKDRLVIVGMGGHAKSVIDSILSCEQFEIAGYTDLRDFGSYRGIRYLGTDDRLREIYGSGTRHVFCGIGCLGKSTKRNVIYSILKSIGFKLPVIIDSSAIVSDTAQIGEGAFIGKRCVVNAESSIGKMAIINTGVILEHENRIGDYCHIACGVVLCGNVTVEDNVFVGANATVIQGVKIGTNSIVGAGSTVLREVPENITVKGIWGD